MRPLSNGRSNALVPGRGNLPSPDSIDPLRPNGRFLACMKPQQEVRHKSEDVDDSVLLDVVRAIRRRVRIVSRDYDIPYIVGYSTDGHTVFIDRHLPKSFRWLNKTVRVDPFLLGRSSKSAA
jgi:hypothetical protein